MSHTKLMTALAVLLSLGIGTACKPPEPAVDPVAEKARVEAEEARVKAEEDARKKAQEEAEEVRKKAAEDARKAAEEAARREVEKKAADARAALQAAAAAVLVDINFEYNRDEIRRADRAKLAAIAEFMKAYPNVRLIIEGHCDERGTIEYNMALGERRAFAARSYLVGLGVSETLFRTISYGKERPKVAGDSEKSWFQNRRCEFKLQ